MSEYQTIYPGRYDDDEKAILEAYQKSLAATTSEPEGHPDAIPPIKKEATTEDMIKYAQTWNPYNPLFTDEEYGKSTKYGSIIAAPAFIEARSAIPYMPRTLGIWGAGLENPIVGNGMDHELFFHTPIQPGDTFTSKLGEASFEDISPPGGEIRLFRNKGVGYLYNQRDELVASIINRQCECFKRWKDPSRRKANEQVIHNMAGSRPLHKYTDDDWEFIKDLWSKETIRGKETLYWEDVNIGDEPAWTCDGPMTTIEMLRYYGPVRGGTLREEVLNGISPMTWKNDYGLYYPLWAQHYCNRDIEGSRPIWFNQTGRNFVGRMLTNWCGDDGFVTKLGWRLIREYPKEKQQNAFPEDYDRPSVLLQVPYLKKAGRFMNAHGLEGDLAISKGYVYDKYEKDGGYYVDLACWVENLDGDILQECPSTVKLPSKKN